LFPYSKLFIQNPSCLTPELVRQPLLPLPSALLLRKSSSSRLRFLLLPARMPHLMAIANLPPMAIANLPPMAIANLLPTAI
jgi:hypothetical protein